MTGALGALRRPSSDGTTEDWFHPKRAVADRLHATLGSTAVGLGERGWHLLRAGVNLPASTLAAGYSLGNGGRCSLGDGLTITCTGQTHRSYLGVGHVSGRQRHPVVRTRTRVGSTSRRSWR